MLILKILENDLHRSKNGTAVPLMVEVPASPAFLPALVSNTSGKLIVSRKLTENNRIRVGVFNYDSEKMDDFIGPMLQAALDLSKQEKWANVLKSPILAFNYIKTESCMPAQPHVCAVPTSWDQAKVKSVLKLKKLDDTRYQKYCHIVRVDVPFISFLSKPDMVGLYTHFLGGPATLLLHNIRRGMSFCEWPS